MAEAGLYCAQYFNSLVHFEGQPGRSSIARVERAHSYRARSASRRTTGLPSHTPSTLTPPLTGGRPACGSHCARPTRAFLGRALREHRSPDRPSAPSHPHPILLIPPPSLGEPPDSPFTARIDRAHSDRARSASKKDRLAAPPFFALDSATPPWL